MLVYLKTNNASPPGLGGIYTLYTPDGTGANQMKPLRGYRKGFSSKMNDADMENSETQVSLDFAENCKYISNEVYQELIKKSEEVGRLLNHMIENPEKYMPKK